MIREKLGKELLFFDGGMWTSLRKVGLQLAEVAEVFNFRCPEVVEEVHRGYLEAGANFITTNTFGANSYRIKKTGYTVDEVIGQAVMIAKKAKEGFKETYIALDIGSTGKCPPPNGDISFEELYEVFKEQAIAGEKYGCDVILLETFTDLEELKAAILAVKDNTSLPVFCTMSFKPDGTTFRGVSLEEMVKLAKALGVEVLGINCVAVSKELLSLVTRLRTLTSIPVMVQPNVGLPIKTNGESSYPITSDEFTKISGTFKTIGVDILGGCCGTDKKYIGKMIYNCKKI